MNRLKTGSPGRLGVEYQSFYHVGDEQAALLLSEQTVKVERGRAGEPASLCAAASRSRIQLHVPQGGVVSVKRRLVQVGVTSSQIPELLHAYFHLEGKADSSRDEVI